MYYADFKVTCLAVYDVRSFPIPDEIFKDVPIEAHHIKREHLQKYILDHLHSAIPVPDSLEWIADVEDEPVTGVTLYTDRSSDAEEYHFEY